MRSAGTTLIGSIIRSRQKSSGGGEQTARSRCAFFFVLFFFSQHNLLHAEMRSANLRLLKQANDERGLVFFTCAACEVFALCTFSQRKIILRQKSEQDSVTVLVPFACSKIFLAIL